MVMKSGVVVSEGLDEGLKKGGPFTRRPPDQPGVKGFLKFPHKTTDLKISPTIYLFKF
jgi:hypothetical protein